MATKDFMPSKDPEILAFTTNFKTLLVANPVSYGTTAEVADEYETKQAAFASTLTLATNPLTRSAGTIFLKDEAKADLVNYTRSVARQIGNFMTVTDAQRQALGLTVRGGRVPRPVPALPPEISVSGIQGRTVTVRLKQVDGKRGKPKDVATATVFTSIGAIAPANMSEWQFAMNTTLTTVRITFAPSDTGGMVWVSAFWSNARGESGPAAKAVSINLPAGGVLPSAKADPAMRISRAA